MRVWLIVAVVCFALAGVVELLGLPTKMTTVGLVAAGLLAQTGALFALAADD